MKVEPIEDVLAALKSLRKKVKKSAQAQAKVEDKLTQLEALVQVLYQHAEPALDKNKKHKKSGKKPKPTPLVKEESTELGHSTQ